MLCVWTVRSHEYADAVPRFMAQLPAGERQRAEAFHFERDRVSYVVSHYALRQVLAGGLGLDGFGHAFEVGPHGKPSLPRAFVDSGLEFSLSHTHGLALIAVSSVGAVGVDVERVVDTVDVHGLAASVFAEPESRHLAGLDAAAARLGFFRLWVRKEAYVKARGIGLADGLREPVLDPATLDEAGGQVRQAAGSAWAEWPIAVPDGYCAALYQRLDAAAGVVRVAPELRAWRPDDQRDEAALQQRAVP
ncbi:4'-phosphopantetheinyl transferase family protein [Ralstonia solanacearum]|uniref:4'-phosphopantetheinyl transferase family protein n=1 Tax=Ralstonia solanacearum TaxID=305 RepID=UPI00186613B2|nr:4'-phosphopantetheinyl transferase superfamily protein [Ralstonia solanacearum]QOK84513.1 4'-phosphopantetheinyl transferase superfamily protein [Ralstonia solanacearum]